MPKQKLEKGKCVRVYQRPITDEDYEDTALLMEKVRDGFEPEGYETWWVKFRNEFGLYRRMVHERNMP